ncbi:uncharacterized protein LOC111371625 isoform X1 [Olea europaea var. sylvestris]|uniref:uncharacterized protein LOC111371625 isoform X1 n=2 Tax=Olea europaea var. sylvestris TaxID=158386 RepID=UPI000C1D503A|nr:uncharacterized protein LOC111371625 isoform X1 [Olea europaea var. sylvestris]XP_022849463.1 uncharacterized protein LOC111371625 isoform X1 [Olea europaea var. sylvestris]
MLKHALTKQCAYRVECAIQGAEMNGIHQNGKDRSFEKTFPGCLGRMVNLFDLNGAVAGNRLLTDKSHQDGSPPSRSRAEEASVAPSNHRIEDDAIVPEINRTGSNRKSNATPIKMLIAQEMSKEVDSKHSPANVVAKLMGLDALPRQEPNSAAQRSHFRGHPRSHLDIPVSYWEQQNGCFEYIEPNECSDVYEIRKKSQKTNYLREKSPQKGNCNETSNDRKMALIRQKFVEAKRLSMDEKLRQSKQFQDALEVLNSNKDLFLRCLQEPNSTFSQNPYNLQSIPPSETKRITILRPSKMVDSNNFVAVGNKRGKQVKKCAYVGHLNELEKSHQECSSPSGQKINKTSTQPTRIVVLKPSSVRPQDMKAVDSPRSESPRISHGEDFFGDLEDDEKQESKDVAKAITQKMRETFHRDETLLSSVFSNGYVGDESSFNKSEIEYADGNLSDSEVISPVSRHSWDYVNRFGSPYSSSFSHVSYSPESSVCREAKKRLSERWAMMTSNGSFQEQRPVRRSSSTLGEMLSLSETKKAGMPKELRSTNEEPRSSDSLFVSEQTKDENLDDSPRNLSRSKSVPVYSAEFGTRLNVDILDPDGGKPEVFKEATKTRSGKSSFKGKVSSLFFSRNKKPSKDKSECKDESRSSGIHSGQVGKDRGEQPSDEGPECLSPFELDPSIKAAPLNLIGQQGMRSPKSGLSVTKPVAPLNPSENQDHPSPISVLYPNFEEDEHTVLESSRFIKPGCHGLELPFHHVRSNLIGKSPPIGSIARTLPSDLVMDTASSYPLKPSLPSPGAEEEEWFLFVQTLLSVAGLDSEEQPDSFLARWHSPESPLNPSLRDKYIDLNEKETLHEAERRRKRSTRKLVFDCVNAALVDIVGYGSASCQRAIPCIGASSSSLENASLMMVDQVWAGMKIWFSSDARCVLVDYGDDNCLVVESVVRKEVVGKRWTDHLRLEIDNLGKEIEGKLLEELVEDAVIELTGRI